MAPSFASALGGSSRELVSPFCTHYGRRHKGECWRLTSACLACGSNEHKIKDCPRAHSFTSPWTRDTSSAIQRGNKSVASPSVPRKVTQTVSRQDARAPTRAYAMKAVEDTDAPDVIVGNFTIFDTIMQALIDPGSTHSYVCTDIPNLGNLLRSETKYNILVTNPLGHRVMPHQNTRV